MTHAQAIAQAQHAIDAGSAKAATCPWRPAYHFAAPAGWINDPNGLIHFRGEYHLFYQHHPYSAGWGPMHWGHVVSTDLIHWRPLPVALAPTEPYELSGDACGCFSGSAVEHDGRLVLMYTGDSPAHSPRETQNIATSDDGITFQKHLQNPVIRDFPPEGSLDFRDPKIWRHDGTFYAVVGTGRDGTGKVVMYRSVDLANWEYLGVAAQSDGTQGNMWECPDLFETDGEHLLLFSPTGLGRPLSMYLSGTLNYPRHTFHPIHSGLIDHGSDFYAPQTLLAPDGRRIMIGWMQAWRATIPTEKNGWSGAMSLPRELRLSGGRLLQFPVREIEALRRDQQQYSHSVRAGQVLPLPLQEDSMELRVRIIATQPCAAAGVRVRCSADGAEFTDIRWSPQTAKLTLDRTSAGDGAHDQRSVLCTREFLDVRIFVDRSSVEVFSADGTIAITSRVYPCRSSRGVALYAAVGDAHVDCTCWSLVP